MKRYITVGRKLALPVVFSMLLGGCAGSPDYANYGAEAALTPQRVSARPQLGVGKQVLWGGVIMKTVNLKDRTQIEVLAFPLNSRERPNIDQPPLGRFIFEKRGYLEPANYASQRQITVLGTVTGTLPGQVGESDYNYPLVTPRQHTLWPYDRGYTGSNIRFGIGRGSNGSWGGVGIGF